MRHDVVVLGAGIVGICVALHLQKRGRSVVLVDRRGAAEETSFGNAGLIQREGVYPYGFPHDFGALLRYSLNRTIDAHYHPSALPRLAPFLWQYWRHSRPARHAEVARRYAKLIEHCVSEHEALVAEAGAGEFIRRVGWMRLFRTERERETRFAEAERWHREFGINHRALDARALRELEPHLAPVLVGALHWTDPISVSDPQGLALAYLALFERLGGRFLQGNAATLHSDPRWEAMLPVFNGDLPVIVDANDAIIHKAIERGFLDTRADSLWAGVEAGATLGWERWIGNDPHLGAMISINHFGASAPYQRIYKEFGLTAERVGHFDCVGHGVTSL